ncbi:MAG: hypothetical protein K2O04_06580, partial [Clostridiales bacterium]|nr:hypothetical protein [Clostridiales bacterium]
QDRKRSDEERKAIRRYYAKQAAKGKAARSSGANNRGQQAAETFPHFRHYLKSNHPALILGELEPDEYKYRKVTHSEREGRHLNEKVEPNPDPTDDRPMYIVKRQRHDKKKHFGKRLPWKPPKK